MRGFPFIVIAVVTGLVIADMIFNDGRYGAEIWRLSAMAVGDMLEALASVAGIAGPRPPIIIINGN